MKQKMIFPLLLILFFALILGGCTMINSVTEKIQYSETSEDHFLLEQDKNDGINWSKISIGDESIYSAEDDEKFAGTIYIDFYTFDCALISIDTCPVFSRSFQGSLEFENISKKEILDLIKRDDVFSIRLLPITEILFSVENSTKNDENVTQAETEPVSKIDTEKIKQQEAADLVKKQMQELTIKLEEKIKQQEAEKKIAEQEAADLVKKQMQELTIKLEEKIDRQEAEKKIAEQETGSQLKSVAIFIDAQIYSEIKNEIDRFKEDIYNDLNAQVFLFSDNWSDITVIKNIIIDKFNNNGLLGAIFIGDIPTAYFEYQNLWKVPTDWYFQDLSDNFIDEDNDGKFEREYYMNETDITTREIWTGRIKSPIEGVEAINLLKSYFNRNHAYRTGDLEYSKKMLYFGSIAMNQDKISESEYTQMISSIDSFTGLYDSDDQIDYVYDLDVEKQKNKYLSKLINNNYDFVFANIHGTRTTQELKDGINIDFDEIKNSKPNALFTSLFSCSNGDFTKDNYLAGWYLLSGNGLVVAANTTISMSVGTSFDFLDIYKPLRLGVTFGDMDKHNRSFMVTHLFGDPTLTFRTKPQENIPSLLMDTENLDFGDVERGEKGQIYIMFKNNGEKTLKIDFKAAPFSVNNENGIFLGYWDVFYYENPETNYKFRDIEVSPGDFKIVPFVFYPRIDAPKGDYSMVMFFNTNDPDIPYLKIYLNGKAI